jgi:hypothetical protein
MAGKSIAIVDARELVQVEVDLGRDFGHLP